MTPPRKTITSILTTLAIAATIGTAALAEDQDQLPPWPNDLSPSGLYAAGVVNPDTSGGESLLSQAIAARAQAFLSETRAMGLKRRAGLVSLSCPLNVRANDPTGDAVGETQSEVAVAVFGDTVVIGWNDSRGFSAGFTISSFGYSTDGGATFTDGGNVALSLSTVAICQAAPFWPVRQRCSMMPSRRSAWAGSTPQSRSPSWASGSSRRSTSSAAGASPRPGQ